MGVRIRSEGVSQGKNKSINGTEARGAPSTIKQGLLPRPHTRTPYYTPLRHHKRFQPMARRPPFPYFANLELHPPSTNTGVPKTRHSRKPAPD